MNTWSTTHILGGLALVVLVVVGFFLYHAGQKEAPTTPPLSTTTVSSQPEATTSSSTTSVAKPAQQPPKQPTFTQDSPAQIVASARFDTASLTSTSTYPVITGTASISEVGLVVSTMAGYGLAGAGHISVTSGHWEYPIPVPLTPGSYRLTLVGGPTDVTATLTVK